MTPGAFLAALDRLNLTRSEAARVLGVTARCVNHYGAGTRTVTPWAERLLWACERDPAMLRELLRPPAT